MAKKKPDAKIGRPLGPALTPAEKSAILKRLALGDTWAEIADLLGMPRETLRDRVKRDPDEAFHASIKATDEVLIEKVVKSLWLRCNGMSWEEKTMRPKMEFDQKSKSWVPAKDGSMVLVETKSKYSLPDPGSIQLYLYNKDRENWKAVQHLEHSGAPINPELNAIPDEQIAKILEAHAKSCNPGKPGKAGSSGANQ